MDSEDPPFIGDWYQQKQLGKGAFGIVTLWKNHKTLQCVAIKKCHVSGNNQNDATIATQRERWNREVEYMTNEIRNENIVQGIKIKPDSFLEELNRRNPSPMPVLVMEYCEGGDLRRKLNANQNTSGFGESEVRNILKCLSNAISYLHDLKITHRDIKPENIVIQVASNGQRVYKLTDLGYAKPLDFQSVVASLVGTLEYIAPELCFADKYSNTVDYWSMGIIAFEIITGSRPFVPHMPLAQWMITVNKKTSSNIYIIENTKGEIQYLDSLPAEYHVSKCFAKNMEKWFKLALEWNGKHRGSVFEESNTSVGAKKGDCLPPIKVLKIFSMLDAILKKRILTVFCLSTYRQISYEVMEHTTMAELTKWLANDTGFAEEKIRYILPLGNIQLAEITKTTKPVQLCWSNGTDLPMLYIVHIGKPLRAMAKPEIPHLVCTLFENPKQKFKPHILKRLAYNTYYMLKTEQRNYEASLDGMKNYVLRLNHEVELHDSEANRMVRFVYSLEGAIKLLDASLRKFDEKRQEQAYEMIAESSLTYTKWSDECAKLSGNVATMVGACQQISKRYNSVHRRSREIMQHRLLDQMQQDYFGVRTMEKSFEIIREQLLKKVYSDKQQDELLKFAYNCLKQRDKLLQDKEFIRWHNETAAVAVEIEEITKTIDKAISQAEKYQRDVHKVNEELQDRFWEMIKVAQTPIYMPDIDRILVKNAKLDVRKGNDEQAVNFKIGEMVSSDLKSKAPSSLCFGEGDHTASLIHDNEQLRMTLSSLMLDVSNDFK